MSKQKKMEKILSFLNSNRTDYISFIRDDLEDETVRHTQKMENTRDKRQVKDQRSKPTTTHKWMPNGVYGSIADQPPVHELDFEQFSFTALKELADNPSLKETVEAFEDVYEHTEKTRRRKKLRVFLFESLRYVESPYYNMDLYLDIFQHMTQALDKAHTTLQDIGVEVLAKTFDSFTFQATNKKAEQIQNKVNDAIETHRLALNTFDSVVIFYNVGLFNPVDGDWYMFKTSGTDYDPTKEAVAKALTDNKFQEAFEHISDGKQRWKGKGNTDKFNEYAATLTEIKTSPNMRVADED